MKKVLRNLLVLGSELPIESIFFITLFFIKLKSQKFIKISITIDYNWMSMTGQCQTQST